MPQIVGNFSLTFKLGDESNSFCGSVKKFLVFSNSTYLKAASAASDTVDTCPLTLGFVSPICLSTYKGVDVCTGGYYFNSTENQCSGNLYFLMQLVIHFHSRMQFRVS